MNPYLGQSYLNSIAVPFQVPVPIPVQVPVAVPVQVAVPVHVPVQVPVYNQVNKNFEWAKLMNKQDLKVLIPRSKSFERTTANLYGCAEWDEIKKEWSACVHWYEKGIYLNKKLSLNELIYHNPNNFSLIGLHKKLNKIKSDKI